ncbi:TetR/AcrR family transcriptional regulator [Gracilibacillus salinarum]|uniref:TetR/AcrR family transcriptional regulator n=1 Tax=Gracilibacillus salinarum TaxID=2932255 RepID=A0ABY4GK11_9BACI|nr:TetR/AcrR family transcriptional regulator [Gracilibacillus salinarum]UOQ84529.1 TetR/AcrR family transcriptional regulator [Gracilibacillus salinarum]
MDGFKKRTQQKQEQILQTALQLFSANGIKKVSIAQIAKAAEVSQVSIYNYFDSKHNLVHETMIYYIEKLFQQYLDIMNGDLSFREKIEQIIFNKTALAHSIHDEVYHFLIEQSYVEKIFQEKSVPLFHQLIEEGKQTGYIDHSLSNEAIMLYLHMFKDYMQKDGVSDYILPITEDVMHLFFYGMIGKKN